MTKDREGVNDPASKEKRRREKKIRFKSLVTCTGSPQKMKKKKETERKKER